jgi:signal peptidase I
MQDGVLSVNGQPAALERLGGETADTAAVPLIRWNETLSGRTYLIETERVHGPRSFSAYVVPEGHLFVVGDNRDNSADSRVWGPVPLENVKGTARFIWWSRSWERVDAPVR